VLVGRFQLEEIRLVSHHLNLVGRIADPRSLASMVELLVGLASQRTLNHRLTRRGLAGGVQPPAREEGRVLASTPDRLADIRGIHAIPAVPYLLQLTSRLLDMRFVAVASVTAQRWTACEVYDVHGFGVQAGQDLVLETTICNEVRQHHRTVQFDQASTHPGFCTHHTPLMYGFESYLAVPIFRRDQSFFGTLCALDARPSRLRPETIRCVEVFAQLIGIQLDVLDGHGEPGALRLAVPERDAALEQVMVDIEVLIGQAEDGAVRAVATGMLQVMREHAIQSAEQALALKVQRS